MVHKDFDQPMPNRHVMTLLTFIGLLPLVYCIPGWVISYITPNQWWSTVWAVGIIVPIHGYLCLPLLIKLYRQLVRK